MYLEIISCLNRNLDRKSYKSCYKHLMGIHILQYLWLIEFHTGLGAEFSFRL